MKKILNGIGFWYFITICGFLSLIISIFKWDIDKLHDSWPNLLLQFFCVLEVLQISYEKEKKGDFDIL